MTRETLKKKRQQQGLTQEQVSQRAHISRSYYTNIETGKKRPSLGVGQKLAVLFCSSVDEIFFDGDVHKGNIN